jgi:chaperonin cofactor prefoldin
MNEDDFKRLLDAHAERLENRFDRAVGETRHHLDLVAERMEKKFDLLAETVRHLDEKLDREAASIRQEMRSGFTETQAMIKFSHAELDRRVRTLEDGMADLQARVERLEQSTH